MVSVKYWYIFNYFLIWWSFQLILFELIRNSPLKSVFSDLLSGMPISIANAAFCSPAEALHTKMMYSTAQWLQDCRLEKCLVQHWAIFPPSISLYFTFECIIVLCWYHSVTLYPQPFIADTERCPWGCGVVTKYKVLCSVWGGLEWEECGNPQLLPLINSLLLWASLYS